MPFGRTGNQAATALADLAFAVRSWIRKPAIPLAVVFALSLGTGVAGAAYSVLDATLFHSLPFARADRLVFMWGSKDDKVRRGLSAEAIDSWQLVSAFDGVSLFLPAAQVSFGDQGAASLSSVAVQVNFTRVLGIEPILGRSFLPTDAGDNRLVLVSYGVWRQYLGGKKDIVGSTIRLDGANCVVLGVMPKDFFFPEHGVDIWRPAVTSDTALNPGQMLYLAVARLAEKHDITQARLEFESTLASLARDSGIEAKPVGIFPLSGIVVRDYRLAIWTLAGAAAALLLILCTTVGTLLGVRSHERQKELTVRAALGASPRRLCWHILIEQFMLVGIGVGLGTGLSTLCLLLVHELGVSVPRLGNASFDIHGYSVVAVIAICIVPIFTFIGGRPIRQLSPANLLKTFGWDDNLSRRSLFRALVLLDLALTPAMLVVAALCLTEFIRLSRIEWGFQAEHGALIELRLAPSMNRHLEQQIDVTESAIAAVRSVPGVEAVGMGYFAPIQYGTWRPEIRIRDSATLADFTRPAAEFRISQGFFRALGVPVLLGREFSEADGRSDERVVVINEALAHAVWPNVTNPIGRQIRFVHEQLDFETMPSLLAEELRKIPYGDDVPWRVIGVVPHIRTSATEVGAGPSVYIDYRQQEHGLWYGSLEPRLIVRSSRRLQDVLATATKVLRKRFSSINITSAVLLDDLVEGSIDARGSRRLLAASSVSLTAIALLITGMGVYALFAEMNHRRRQEIGIRLALGASRTQVSAIVIGEAISLMATGLGLGVATSLLATTFVTRVLFSSTLTLVTAWASAALLLLAVVGIATAIPLRRSLSVDPAVSLRSF